MDQVKVVVAAPPMRMHGRGERALECHQLLLLVLYSLIVETKTSNGST